MRRFLTTILRWLLWFSLLGVAGALVVPAVAYVAGKRLIGSYEGKLGFIDYADSIYAAASRGEVLAWLVLLSPALVWLVWYLILRLQRRLLTTAG
ncbi:MAG: hypothetical protein H6979_01470 [Chromatiales bacterium]|nr:hypothetical protein [Chromatiales bacterium]